MVDQGKKTHKHLVEALRAGITVEEGTILRPDAVDAKGREVGFVRRTGHRWVLDQESGLAGIDGELPDASSECICDEDEVVVPAEAGHAVQRER